MKIKKLSIAFLSFVFFFLKFLYFGRFHSFLSQFLDQNTSNTSMPVNQDTCSWTPLSGNHAHQYLYSCWPEGQWSEQQMNSKSRDHLNFLSRAHLSFPVPHFHWSQKSRINPVMSAKRATETKEKIISEPPNHHCNNTESNQG